MAQSWLEYGLAPSGPGKAAADKKIYGVAPATVLANTDSLGEARVQLKLPWLPGYEPWARVATLMAGSSRGSFFLPQVGDEVLVAFNQGDIREPFVIGSLWNTQDKPPNSLMTDPITKRTIKTPIGHEITFDETDQSVTITSATKQTLTLGRLDASLAAGGKASIKLTATGDVTIEGAVGITLKAPTIKLDGTTISISGSASAKVDGGTQCTIAGTQIDIG